MSIHNQETWGPTHTHILKEFEVTLSAFFFLTPCHGRRNYNPDSLESESLCYISAFWWHGLLDSGILLGLNENLINWVVSSQQAEDWVSEIGLPFSFVWLVGLGIRLILCLSSLPPTVLPFLPVLMRVDLPLDLSFSCVFLFITYCWDIGHLPSIREVDNKFLLSYWFLEYILSIRYLRREEGQVIGTQMPLKHLLFFSSFFSIFSSYPVQPDFFMWILPRPTAPWTFPLDNSSLLFWYFCCYQTPKYS